MKLVDDLREAAQHAEDADADLMSAAAFELQATQVKLDAANAAIKRYRQLLGLSL